MKTIVCLIGKCAVGKTTLEIMLSKNEKFHRAISMTTREKRSNEVDGIDYIFLNDEEFDKQIQKDGIYEQTSYVVSGKTLRYALVPSGLVDDKINIAVVNPHGFKQLHSHKELKIIPILINSNIATLIERYLRRETSPSKYEKLAQRLIQDDKDFSDFNTFCKENKIKLNVLENSASTKLEDLEKQIINIALKEE